MVHRWRQSLMRIGQSSPNLMRCSKYIGFLCPWPSFEGVVYSFLAQHFAQMRIAMSLTIVAFDLRPGIGLGTAQRSETPHIGMGRKVVG